MLKRAAVHYYQKGEQKTRVFLSWCNLHDWVEQKKWRRVLFKIVVLLLAFELIVGVSGSVLLYLAVRSVFRWASLLF